MIPARISSRIPALLVVMMAVLAAPSCSAPDRVPAVPKALQAKAVVDGMENIRYWQDGDLAELKAEGIESVRREVAHLGLTGKQDRLPPANFLAVSGGGENGAFGAGLLVGWTEAGTRPEFKLVTGVSTGALTAPFAFLGPDYDEVLTDVYTNITADNVLKKRNLLAAIFDDAMTDNAPLRSMIAKYVTPEMLAALAAEYEKGRLLLIGTTNLDARRPVVWNITKIAASGHPGALDLIRNILVASSAIPGAFPPMMIDVLVDGMHYQEMHVDGGASAQVFVYPPALNVGELARAEHADRDRHAYVIRNAQLAPDWADTKRETLTIAGRAVSALIQNQGIGDLFRIYATTERDGVDFNLAYIPPTFNVPLNEPFDQHYMRELFKLGYEMGRAGYSWKKVPPGY